jgi:hypothetical protein
MTELHKQHITHYLLSLTFSLRSYSYVGYDLVSSIDIKTPKMQIDSTIKTF